MHPERELARAQGGHPPDVHHSTGVPPTLSGRKRYPLLLALEPSSSFRAQEGVSLSSLSLTFLRDLPAAVAGAQQWSWLLFPRS